MTEYPAADHYAEVHTAREAVVEFVAFLREKGVGVGRTRKHEYDLGHFPVQRTEEFATRLIDMLTFFDELSDIELEKLADEFFEIDQAALEAERRAMLDSYRNPPKD